MPTFPSKPLNPTALTSFSHRVKRNPLLFFGLPFMLTVVGASFGLSHLTQTRYDVRDQTMKVVAKEESLGMSKNRRKLNLQEEYWVLSFDFIIFRVHSACNSIFGVIHMHQPSIPQRMQANADELDNWEQKRIERPPGVE
ncbi:cytochrome c oxidase assembly protein COX16-domain-containing protein [Jimgerdemannia flammicorona]|uniref:Cytochrome c oxidase assembly protein COX16-domain-containing protein n=2 Tax=Jimgerdemannia flammicorona TaxID=994334 RepID=A0A433DF97_9FUNG|nr:cytochrome c oxidase assembly protein COX16-domain-containing protein [Jimgerdemannia flammicorona]RUS30534.1 cytochrome c oxidase assembly protein COX16-domain-containing protein [Jimgerdemannia flammicorona]